MTREPETKLAGELTYKDVGKRVRGYFGARGMVRGKPAPTWNTIKSLTFSNTHVTVTVHRNKWETAEFTYWVGDSVTLR